MRCPECKHENSVVRVVRYGSTSIECVKCCCTFVEAVPYKPKKGTLVMTLQNPNVQRPPGSTYLVSSGPTR